MSTTILFQTNTFGYSSTIDYVYNSLSGSDNCQEKCFCKSIIVVIIENDSLRCLLHLICYIISKFLSHCTDFFEICLFK